MALRLRDITKCLWCLIFLHVKPWLDVKAVTVKGPPNPPSTVEAQAKFFQYRHLPTHEDYDQGHRLGSERHFTERHERARPSEGLFSAKVRWGDKKGGYGEHYWDLNHAGHNNDHDHDHHSNDGYESNTDDGSYDPQIHEDPYDEPTDHVPSYESDYNPDNNEFDETNRAKRHHNHKRTREREQEGDSNQRVHKPKPKYRQQVKETNESSQGYEEKIQESAPRKSHKKAKQFKPVPKEQDYEEDYEEKVITLKDIEDERKPKQFQTPKQLAQENSQDKPGYGYENGESEQFPPYDTARVRQQEQFAANEGAKVRQPEKLPSYEGVINQQVQPVPAPSRLYLEASTGHVIDRATGQAYVLQPVAFAQNPINYT